MSTVNSMLRLFAGSALACCVALAGATWAQQDKKTTRTETKSRTTTTEIRRSSVILGATVHLHGGHSYGKVHEFVFNDHGCVDYVIVVHDDHYIPVPWVVTTFNFGDRVLVLDIDRDRIDEIPTFTQITELNNTEFVTKVKTFYKTEERSRTRTGDGKDKDDEPKGKDRPKDAPKKATPEKGEKKADEGAEKKTEKKSDSKKSDSDKKKNDDKDEKKKNDGQ